jgi:recombination DNA repair RAD52 pathway protein
MYNVFAKKNENESDDDTITTITQTAALMAAPSSTSTSKGTAISAKVAAAINQLSATKPPWWP